MKSRATELKSGISYEYVHGVDEVGMSPWAGPVVVCIYYPLAFVGGVNDCKSLTPSQRFRLLNGLTRLGVYSLCYVTPAAIDLYGLRRSWLLAVTHLLSEAKEVEKAIVDGKYERELCPCPDAELIIECGADARYYSVAAASIVAKCAREILMAHNHVRWPQFSFHKHFGYPTIHHRRELEEHGPTPIHRYRHMRKFLGVDVLRCTDEPVVVEHNGWYVVKMPWESESELYDLGKWDWDGFGTGL